MRYKAKKITVSLGLLLVFSSFFQANAWIQEDERLFQEAKILIFDKEWREAQEKLDELLEEYPESSWYSQALFWKGKCLEEQRGKEVDAINTYKRFVLLKKRSESLAEESEIAIIDLAFKLYERGKRSHLREIETRLFSRNKVVKYYAAFKLSYIKNKKVASKGIPVLKDILQKESDTELKDRAKIALLRIDPEILRDFEEERYERKASILHIRVQNKWKKEPTFSLNIPWALADLALSAIPDEAMAELREEGYDLDGIIKEITEYRGKVFEIKTKDSIIKIWID